MASDFNSIAKAIRYLGDCVRYLADKYVAVNDRVYSDWNEASKVVGDVGRDHVADYAEASHKQGKSRTWRHSHLMEREEQLSMQSRGSHVDPRMMSGIESSARIVPCFTERSTTWRMLTIFSTRWPTPSRF